MTFIKDFDAPEVYTGDQLPGAQFGSSLAECGDLNQDGYKGTFRDSVILIKNKFLINRYCRWGSLWTSKQRIGVHLFRLKNGSSKKIYTSKVNNTNSLDDYIIQLPHTCKNVTFNRRKSQQLLTWIIWTFLVLALI